MARVVLGITGGIAAYKATQIIRLLTEAGHDVKVLPTKNALRFIGATTLEALSHNTIEDDLYSDVADVKHVELGQSADLVIVAPATAAFLARYATGLADDLLLNTLLVAKAPVLIAPAMHTEMWHHSTTQRNVAALVANGVQVMAPASGRLTGSDSGVGRLPEPEQIVAEALAMLAPDKKQSRDFEGLHILISAGGTREQIDPVRFIGNNSSGKQGIALAKAAAARGAQVTVVGANIAPVEGCAFVSVSTTQELSSALDQLFAHCDVYISAAAISDFRVENASDAKLKRAELGSSFDLHLVANPDLLASVCARKTADQIVVGFAAETVASQDELAAAAKAKLATKGCDLIVANNVSAGAVFDADTNSVLIVDRTGMIGSQTGSKDQVATAILDVLAQRL